MCNKIGIWHYTVSPDKHQSNGRVKRAIRKIWQVIRKTNVNKEVKDDDIPELINKINNTFCRAVGTTPDDAWRNGSKMPLSYKGEFKKLFKEKFKPNENVFVAELKDKNESKLECRFKKPGTIVKVLENDSYLVWCNGKLIKRNHASLVKRK